MGSVSRMLGLGALAGLCLTLTACGSNFRKYEALPETGATLEGTISYAGQRVPAALVIVNGGQTSANGKVGDDGRYVVKNAPLGDVTIGINTAAARGDMMGKMMAASQGKGPPPPRIVDVPMKFADPTNSGIKTTIKKGSNTLDIVIR